MLLEAICDTLKGKTQENGGTSISQRTENQVNEMKKQTIGVEVEMNSVTRRTPPSLLLGSSECTQMVEFSGVRF